MTFDAERAAGREWAPLVTDPLQLDLPLPDLGLPPSSVRRPARADRIFCNRNLRLDQIDVVGFDMDYTLAPYRQDALHRLSIEATVAKLVGRGYPDVLREMPARPDFPIRGLLVDKKHGNVLKMDRFKYVKRAFHGLRELSREERRAAYHTRRLRPSSGRYHWVDTLFGLPEVSVYAAAVEVLDASGGRVDYAQLFHDVRVSIDEAHRDGTMKKRVLADLDSYIERDPRLAPALHRLRSAGKRLFLLTNSHAPYSEAVMSFILDPPGTTARKRGGWKRYFDWVFTAAAKPLFFTGRAPFRPVVVAGGEATLGAPVAGDALERGGMYAGGNMEALGQALGVTGDRVLYVGDHIYGDVLRAKKESAWRTMMVVQEMAAELRAQKEVEALTDRSDELLAISEGFLDAQREHQALMKRAQQALADAKGAAPELEAERLRHRRAADKLKVQLRAVDTERRALARSIASRYHPAWGPLFKEGSELSSFGQQVETFACLYTSRVSNLLAYSPLHYFQSPRDAMPHER